MKIYYNRFYTSRPFIGKDERANSFGVVYCGDSGLLNLMMLHGGIPSPQTTSEERQAYYHNNLKKEELNVSLFSDSFSLDPFSVSNALLHWRDSLVSAGWDMESGNTDKLCLLKSIEPIGLPVGIADCWKKVLDMSNTKILFPRDSEITVTHKSEWLDPKIKTILDNQEKLGLKIEYKPTANSIADGDLGRLQDWLLSEASGSISLNYDGTIRVLSFSDEDLAIKYIASMPSGSWDVYLCQQAKQFDNTLRRLGKPVTGSELDECEPQVVQLFILGNGLFEYPFNLNRILAWLNSPINPLRGKLRRKLTNALVKSGGVGNEEWNNAIKEYEDSLEDEKEKKSVKKRLQIFLPLPQNGELETKDVIRFNESLKKWANDNLLAEKFHYEDIIKEQFKQITVYCNALLSILGNYGKQTISFLELQNFCQSIIQKKSYVQYEPEAGCLPVINKIGNINSDVDSMVWFCINNDETNAYPYDFLTDDEHSFLREKGVKLFDRDFHSLCQRNAMAQNLLHTKHITLVETGKINGEKTNRHPLMILLNEFSEGKLSQHFEFPEVDEAQMTTTKVVDNSSESECIKLEEGIELTVRAPKGEKESFSSMEMLLQHPFDYVCNYIARLNDISSPSVKDLERTKGNVAHLIIQKVFEEKDPAKRAESMGSQFNEVFDSAIDACGLLLRQPEFAIDLKELNEGMKKVLKGLSEIIAVNDLTVDGCEVELEEMELPENGRIGSIADMLLSDNNDNKVIFDFKWTPNIKKYKEKIENNLHLQLAIYGALERHHSGKNVRTAYILLPSLTLLSADYFKRCSPIDREETDIMRQAINGYVFRLNQFAERKIERAEELPLEKSEYGLAGTSDNLYPLEMKDGVIKKSYEDYQKLR